MCYIFSDSTRLIGGVIQSRKVSHAVWRYLLPSLHLVPARQARLGYFYRATVRLHVMQRTVQLSQLCLSVRPSVRCVYCEILQTFR